MKYQSNKITRNMKQNTYHPRTLLLATLLPLLACLAGCVQDETIPGSGTTGQGVTIRYTFDELQTRSKPATTAEKIINEVYFVFYDEAGTYKTWQRASVSSGSDRFPLPLDNLTPGSKYRTLIVANYDNHKADGKSFEQYMRDNSDKTYETMLRQMKSQTFERRRVVTPLPLFGILLGQDEKETLFTAPAEGTTGELPFSVRFSRAVSRFDLHNMAAGSLNIQWVKVCNYRDAGYFFHQDAPLGDAVVKGTATGEPPTLDNLPAGYVKVKPPLDGQQHLTEGGLYAYPNIVSYVTQDDDRTTFLLIAGYYQAEGAETPNTTKLTYYRANVADVGMSQVLKRNFVYTVVINSVKREGAATEDDAAAEKDRLLDYVVDDAWEDDGTGTVTDDKGNFLTVSRTSVILDPPAGEAGVVKVAVKEGLTWKVTWRDTNQTAFKYEKIDDGSFRIVTLNPNNSEFINSAQLEVEATGGSVNPAANPLKVTIYVTQLSSKPELHMLTVEGQTGTIHMDVPGQGVKLRLQVITGGIEGQWRAVPQSDLTFASVPKTTGANKGMLEINFDPYTATGSNVPPRTGTLKVYRTPLENVDPVTIVFSQVKSPYLVSVHPNYGDGNPLVIEGFSTDPDVKPNGVATTESFWVTLVDPDNYTFSVQTNFAKDADAYLTLGKGDATRQAKYVATPGVDSLMSDGTTTKCNLHVFRTGPGDNIINGDVIIWAEPLPGKNVPRKAISFPVVIQSSCAIGDVKIGTLTVADRNVGTPTRKNGDNEGLNYTDLPFHPDRNASMWRGDKYRPGTEVDNACNTFGKENYNGSMAEGWRQPAKSDWAAISERTIWTKERICLVTDNPANGYVGCWLPHSPPEDDFDDMFTAYSGVSTQPGRLKAWGLKYGKNTWNEMISATMSVVRCVK